LESDLRIKAAVDCLKSGGIIAIPTDTVYGLGADPFNPDAVQKLYTIKGRPEGKPIPLVLGSVEDVNKVAQNLPGFFFYLTERFWPGGLTIIVQSKKPATPAYSRWNYRWVTYSKSTAAIANSSGIWWSYRYNECEFVRRTCSNISPRI
jgi:L-threonylcarbamoyladenylate synthase